MAYKVEIKSGSKQVSLPNGGLYDEGDEVTLTNEQYFKITSAALAAHIDNGVGTWVPGDDEVYSAGDPVAVTAEALPPAEDDIAEVVGTVNDLVTDVTALQASLTGTGKALASA